MGYVSAVWGWCRSHALVVCAVALVVAVAVGGWVWVATRPAPHPPHVHGLAGGTVGPSPAGVVYFGTDAFGGGRIATNPTQVRMVCDRQASHGGDVSFRNGYGDTAVLYRGEDKVTYIRRVSAAEVAAGATHHAGDVVAVDLVGNNPQQPLVQWMEDGTVHVVAGSELSREWAQSFGLPYLTVPFVWVAFTARCADVEGE